MTPKKQRPEFVSPGYAARIIGCSATAVKSAIRAGRLAALEVATDAEGRVHYAIRMSDLSKWSPLPVGQPAKES